MKKKIAFEEPSKESEPEEEDDEINLEDDDDEDEEDFDPDAESLATLFNHFFTNEDGVNIADVLTSLKNSIDMYNKILLKLLKK